MNVALLRECAAWFRAHPGQGDMDAWACATTCCIGGLAIQLSDPETFRDLVEMDGDSFEIVGSWETCARQVLRLPTREMAWRLFNSGQWEGTWPQTYDNTPAHSRGYVMAAYIEHFIAREAPQDELAPAAAARELVPA